MGKVEVGRRIIETSRENKVLFDEEGFTKSDLIQYYKGIAKTLLHHARGRPVSMHRFPDGLKGEGFYQKKVPDYFPAWIETTPVPLQNGGRQNQVVLTSPATLVYLADQACITPHVWLSRKGNLKKPDLLVFDLDPPDGSFDPVRKAAKRIRDALEEVGLSSYVQTTGSRGVHVVTPLKASEPFSVVHGFAADLAALLARRHPNDLTIKQRRDERKNRIFLDYLRNSYAQTVVPAYGVRARAGAPVATPLQWSELDDPSLGPRSYTIKNVFRRLGTIEDPWKDIWRHKRSLEHPRERLTRLMEKNAAPD